MTGSPRVWIATFVALVFVTGLAAGVLVDRLWLVPDAGRAGDGRPGSRGGPDDRRAGGRLGPFGPSPERIAADLDRELELSDEQAAKVLEVFRAHEPRMQQLQRDSRAAFLAEQQALDEALVALLTPDQKARFAEVTERLRRGPDRGRGRGGRGDSPHR